ncbi:glycine-rich domain-containing protein [Streptomyces sp. DW26H14]|uniref:glycine-rich domain-containing protein n=1 Tax=Streptomyces sp. DW26H14 TaxID=3435395 RepID=UPI00403DBE93
MSIATQAPARRDARSLLTADEFDGVTATVQRNNPDMDAAVARRVVLEGLKFVAAGAESRERMAPSRVVDEGWHALILHTRTYKRLCDRLGRFVHHVPQAPDAERAPGILDITQAAIEDAGFEVDVDLWRPASDTSIAVAASCQHSPSPCADHPCERPQCDSTPN